MNEKDVKLLKYVALPVLLGLLALWAFVGLVRSRNPDAELALAARQAIHAALDAQTAANRIRSVGAGMRIAGLVVGIVGPLVIAFLIYRVRSAEEVEPEEMLEMMESYGLIELPVLEKPELSAGHDRLLGDPEDSD
jgi:hypothetical protein